MTTIFASLLPRSPGSTLFPYTTLFRSKTDIRNNGDRPVDVQVDAIVQAEDGSQETSVCQPARLEPQDRKSTRLNSSHVSISYAVFCLKKKTCPTCTARASWNVSAAGPR